MKRKLVSVISACIISLALLIGCGVNEGTETENQDIAAAEDIQETEEVTEQEMQPQSENIQEPENVSETRETEMQEPEIEETTDWSQVGIVDEIGTVYNGETIKLVRPDESYSCIRESYEFENPADFLQFVETDISYHDVNIRVWPPEHMECRMSLSGDYELEKILDFNEFGKSYNLIVDGKCIAQFDVEGTSAETPIEDCEVYCFLLYPTEGLILNGFEFKDLQMCNVVDYFGDPNRVVYYLLDSGEADILYIYTEDQWRWKSTEEYGNAVTHHASSVTFHTNDGRNIESIDISLSLTEEEIRAEREWKESFSNEEP